MISRYAIVVGAASAFLFLESPARGQTVVIQGRVEDAVWRQPLAGVRVFSTDSSTAVLTDSLGAFAISMREDRPFTLRAERLGYLSDHYDIGPEAPFRTVVLLLHPAPVELEGVTAVGEAAVTRVLRDLEARRNAYFGPVSAVDRAELERLGRFGTAWDFVRDRVLHLYECDDALSGLCVRNRGYLALRGGPREIPLRVCIDGRESWGAAVELNSLDIRSIALVEIYSHGRGGIRVYTAGYLSTSAARSSNIATPLAFGC